MKHTLTLTGLDYNRAEFTGYQQVADQPPGRFHGTPPFGPFRVQVATTMPLDDWKAAGRPVELEVDL